jgi:hypothetical protein
MPAPWPELPYDAWHETRDTLHAHTQVLGKLAATLAPPEPQLQHAALRLTARGWETAPLPAPDGSGAFGVVLDLHTYEAVVEHSDGRALRIPLTPDRPVGEVTRELLASVRRIAGEVELNLTPQETPWTTSLDSDEEHASFDTDRVDAYFEAATRAAMVLAALRAPYRGRSTPVNAWWGSFDLAVSLFSGKSVEPPGEGFIWRNAGDAEQVEVGWWPGDARYGRAAFYAYALPAPVGFENATLQPSAAHWDADLGEFILDWDDIRDDPDPHASAFAFARSAVIHACTVCGWDPALAASAEGIPPPVV